MQILPDFDLKSHNTFSISAKASYYITCENIEDLQKLSRDEYFRSRPYIVIGGGSNLLFVEDYVGSVVRYTEDAWHIIDESQEHLTIRVAAGKRWHDLVIETAEKGYWGLENLALIPGDTGAAAVQNIGAYGVEIQQVLKSVHTVDLRDGSLRTFSNSECQYDYRHSIFKAKDMGHYVIYAVELTLSKTPNPKLSYAGLQELEACAELTPMTVANHVISIRESKLPDHNKLPNAGSFFMNPIVPHTTYSTLIDKYGTVPHYQVGDQYKIPAAWLIEQCGYKGKQIGQVGCYSKQPLVIVNYGDATADEIVALSANIQRDVRSKFDIEIHPEVRFVKTLDSNPPLSL